MLIDFLFNEHESSEAVSEGSCSVDFVVKF
jgi:hypothetical protein